MQSRARFVVSPALVLSLTLSIAPRAHADDDLQRARALYDEAGELEKEGQWGAAQDRLREAIRIRHTPNLHYALGWALENDDKADEARSEYDLARRLASSSGNAEVEKLAAARIDAIDHKPKAASGVVNGTAPDKKGSSVVPFVVLAGGGIATIAGIALLVSSTSDASTRDSNTQRWCELTACQGTNPTLPESEEAIAARGEASDAASRGNTKQVAGAIVGTVGIVGIAVGTYMLIDSGRRKEGRGAHSRVSVDATTLPGGAFGSATLRF